MTDDTNSPFAHINRGITTLARPSSPFESTDKIAWVYEPTNITEQVQRKVLLAQEMLESLTVISKDEKAAYAAELTLASMYGDLTMLDYLVHLLRLSLSVKGKNHDDILKLVMGATSKISVPTQLSKVRKIASSVVRGNGKEQTEEEEITGN